tara:strand:+ start:427 stop:651 length:225 start_codon:yes stop_codon:yes gene_type:complete
LAFAYTGPAVVVAVTARADSVRTPKTDCIETIVTPGGAEENRAAVGREEKPWQTQRRLEGKLIEEAELRLAGAS